MCVFVSLILMVCYFIRVGHQMPGVISLSKFDMMLYLFISTFLLVVSLSVHPAWLASTVTVGNTGKYIIVT